MKRWLHLWIAIHALAFAMASDSDGSTNAADAPDWIVHHARIITVDDAFSIQQAMAIRDDRILAVGTDQAILAMAGPETRRWDAEGRTILPGLIDSHVHATAASVFEFDHPVPSMETIADVLAYIQGRTKVLAAGQWIVVNQVFITRLKDQRFPTRDELDRVAPNHPVFFRTGPDASLNSLALSLSGIDRDYQIPEGKTGKVERDEATGQPTGILRSAANFVKPKSSSNDPTPEDKQRHLEKLLRDYNSVGITSVAERNASDDGIAIYEALRDGGKLTCRVFLSYGIDGADSLDKISSKIDQAATHPLAKENRDLWLRGIKLFLDGGMLTGSAYMQQPWGVSRIYSISDPSYRGLRYIDPEKLYQICRLSLKHNLQPTAHSVGDAAVQTLVDVYAQIDRDDFPIRDHRPCVTHCNFMTESAIETMARLSIVADLQPAWLWLDGRTLKTQFGDERLALFQPYRTLVDRHVIVGGGSDHMQKIGSLRSVNPYNPFLGMWIAVHRQPQGSDMPLHPEQRLSRQEAIRLYTINNAWLTFEEKHKGSLEPGKLADFIVIDRDILECEVDAIRDIQVMETFLGGKRVFQRAPFTDVPEIATTPSTPLRSPLLFSDGQQVDSPAQWPNRRREILDQWHSILGAWPPRVERPTIEVLETEQREGIEQRRVRLQIAPDQFAEGYILVPPGSGPFPAVFVPFYDPETSIGLSKNPLRDFAWQLAQRGFVSLAIGSPGGDARKPLLSSHADCQPLSYLAYISANAWTALASMPEVDSRRIAIVGHSYGGKWALFGACLWDKYACSVWSDPGIVFDESRTSINYQEPWYLGFDPSVTRKPGLVREESPRTGAYRSLVEQGHDLHELHALMAPRPFLVSGGTEDPPTRWSVLRHAIEVNKLLGFVDRVAMTNRDSHSPTELSNQQIYAFLEYWLEAHKTGEQR